MSKISEKTRQIVRERAQFACEFCGVTEDDAGGMLTIDHFQPKTKGGDDSIENLLYCCMRCNLYKSNYWPESNDEIHLWNPRREPASKHFLLLDDGTLHALTPTGKITLQRLRLNRTPLISYRLQKQQRDESIRLQIRYHENLILSKQLKSQIIELIREQKKLLEEQQKLLKLLRE